MKICKSCKYFMPEDGVWGQCAIYDIRIDSDPFNEDIMIMEDVLYIGECDDFEAKEEA